MPIDINSLFADIIDTPEQRQMKMLQKGVLQGDRLASGLTGLTRAAAPLAQVAGQLGVQRQENLRRAVQPMLGIDPRTTGEKMAEQLQGLDPENPDSLLQAAQAMQSIDPLRAAALRQMAAQKSSDRSNLERQRKIDNLRMQEAQIDLAEAQATQSRRQVSEAALPQIAEQFRAEGFDDLAAQVESNNITVDQANARADARNKVTSSENYVRLSNTEIFNRSTGDIISSDEVPPERIIEVGEGNDKRIVGLNKDGGVAFNVSARDLLSQTTTNSDDSLDPNSTTTAEYDDLRGKSVQEFNVIKAQTAKSLAILDDSVLAAGRVSNMAKAFTANLPTVQAGVMQSRIDLEGAISTIKANVAFDRLQKMRDESKTGGALGNVSNIELSLLESSIASLDANLSPEILRQNIQAVEMHYQNILNAELGLPIVVDLSSPFYEGRVVQRENGEIWVKDIKTNQWISPKDQNTIIIKNL